MHPRFVHDLCSMEVLAPQGFLILTLALAHFLSLQPSYFLSHNC
jgi:hypothetical protein